MRGVVSGGDADYTLLASQISFGQVCRSLLQQGRIMSLVKSVEFRLILVRTKVDVVDVMSVSCYAYTRFADLFDIARLARN